MIVFGVLVFIFLLSQISSYFDRLQAEDVARINANERWQEVENEIKKDVVFCNSNGGLSHIEIISNGDENDCLFYLYCANGNKTSLQSEGYHLNKTRYTDAGFFDIETRVSSMCGGPDEPNEVLLVE